MAKSEQPIDQLSERKKKILKAIVEAHIKEGEPVGSKYLTQAGGISLSPATIRNEMAELEEMGYLEQPHTSAGRIPSELGYRFYVNDLMQPHALTVKEQNELDSMTKSKLTELDQVLERATKLITELTNYTSIAVRPRQTTATVRHFKLVHLNENTFLLIMITSAEVVKTKQIHVAMPVSEGMLERLELGLNLYVSGKTPDEITLPVIMELEEKLHDLQPLVGPIIRCVYEVISELDGGELKLEGMNRLLQYPDYSDLQELKDLLGTLEHKEELLNLISTSDRDHVNVLIGSENAVDVMHNSSLVFKTVKSGGRVVGAIGVIGPTRMDYSRVISTVEQLADSIAGMAQTSAVLPALSEGERQDAASDPPGKR